MSVQPFAQCVIQARLPTGAGTLEGLHDVGVQPDVHMLLGGRRRRAPTFGLEHLLGCGIAEQARQHLFGGACLGEPLVSGLGGVLVNQLGVGFARHSEPFHACWHGEG